MTGAASGGLLGQNQFVFAGHAQQIALTGMFNFGARLSLKNVGAGNTGPNRDRGGFSVCVAGGRGLFHDLRQ